MGFALNAQRYQIGGNLTRGVEGRVENGELADSKKKAANNFDGTSIDDTPF